MKKNKLLLSSAFILTGMVMVFLFVSGGHSLNVFAQNESSPDSSNESNSNSRQADDNNNTGGPDASTTPGTGTGTNTNAPVGAFTTDAPQAATAASGAFTTFPTTTDRDAAEKQLEAARLEVARTTQLIADIDAGIVTNVPRATALAAKAKADQEFQLAVAFADQINAALAALAAASEAELAAQQAAQDKLMVDIDSALSSGGLAAVRAVLQQANNLRANFYGAAVANSDLIQSQGRDVAINEAIGARAAAPVDQKAGIAATITMLTGGTLKEAAENAAKQGGLLAYTAVLVSDQINSGITAAVLESIATQVVTYAVEQAKLANRQVNINEIANALAASNISQDLAVQTIAKITKVDPQTILKTVTQGMQASIVNGAVSSGAYSGIPNSPLAQLYAKLPGATPAPTPVSGPQYLPMPPASGDWPEANYSFSPPGGVVGGTSLTTVGKTQNGSFTEGRMVHQYTNPSGGSTTLTVNLVGAPTSVISGVLQNISADGFLQWIGQKGFRKQADNTYRL